LLLLPLVLLPLVLLQLVLPLVLLVLRPHRQRIRRQKQTNQPR
jgi:hypothetical protein